MKRAWTKEETERLESLLANDTPIRDIADQLGRTVMSVWGKILDLRRTPTDRAQKIDKGRIRRHIKANKDRLHPSPQSLLEERPAPELLAERDVRFSAPLRDLAGFVFGDPPVGYSALDQR